MIHLTNLKTKIFSPKKTAEGLKVINPKTPKLFITPKIYKENNPGRSVINSINCDTSKTLCIVDHHLQPLVKEIPFANKINNFKVTENSFLVTMDVRTLHINIPNNKVLLLSNRKTTATQIRPQPQK